MDYTIQRLTQNVVVIRVGRRLDFHNASEFKVACQDLMSSGTRHFILDFSETGILDSTGLGALLALYRALRKQRNPVALVAPSPPVRQVIKLTRTHKIFPEYESVEEARSGLLHLPAA